MKTIFSSKTPVDFQRTTRRYIPEDRTLHNHRCENLKSYIKKLQDRELWTFHWPLTEEERSCKYAVLEVSVYMCLAENIIVTLLLSERIVVNRSLFFVHH
jgi:hypothetical protein